MGNDPLQDKSKEKHDLSYTQDGRRSCENKIQRIDEINGPYMIKYSWYDAAIKRAVDVRDIDQKIARSQRLSTDQITKWETIHNSKYVA